jgi:hypothetical protein
LDEIKENVLQIQNITDESLFLLLREKLTKLEMLRWKREEETFQLAVTPRR